MCHACTVSPSNVKCGHIFPKSELKFPQKWTDSPKLWKFFLQMWKFFPCNHFLGIALILLLNGPHITHPIDQLKILSIAKTYNAFGTKKYGAGEKFYLLLRQT